MRADLTELVVTLGREPERLLVQRGARLAQVPPQAQGRPRCADRPAVDDALWSALGEPTRRRLLDLLLSNGPHTSTSLSALLPVTRQAVAKHLVALDRAGLVHGADVGQERRYRVDEAQLTRAVAELRAVGASWDARLGRIKRLTEEIEQAKTHD